MNIRHLYKKEDMLSVRSAQAVSFISIFNLILFFVAIIRLNVEVQNIRISHEMRYDIFLTVFRYVAIIEYFLLILILPASAVGSISSERNAGKLDLILGTMLSPTDIVLAKLLSKMSIVFTMLISSLPLASLVFIYGGIKLADAAILILSYTCLSIFLISFGIFLSAVCKNTEMAALINYTGLFIISVIIYVIIRKTFGKDIDLRVGLYDIGRINYRIIPKMFLFAYITLQLIFGFLFTFFAGIAIDPKKCLPMFFGKVYKPF